MSTTLTFGTSMVHPVSPNSVDDDIDDTSFTPACWQRSHHHQANGDNDQCDKDNEWTTDYEWQWWQWPLHPHMMTLMVMTPCLHRTTVTMIPFKHANGDEQQWWPQPLHPYMMTSTNVDGHTNHHLPPTKFDWCQHLANPWYMFYLIRMTSTTLMLTADHHHHHLNHHCHHHHKQWWLSPPQPHMTSH